MSKRKFEQCNALQVAGIIFLCMCPVTQVYLVTRALKKKMKSK